MKAFLTSLVLLFTITTYSQQFSLKSLTTMLTNKALFEQNMVKVGNYPTSISSLSQYECRKSSSSSNTIHVLLEEEFVMDSTMTDVTKKTYLYSSFAENYNTEDETGSTFYSLSILKSQKIKGKLIPSFQKDGAILTVQYVRSSDYFKILNEITSTSKYIETKKDTDKTIADEYISVYQIGSIKIEVKKSNDRLLGGTIKLRLEF